MGPFLLKYYQLLAQMFFRMKSKLTFPLEFWASFVLSKQFYDLTEIFLLFPHSQQKSCECLRCQDPTELGSYSSAWLCPSCPKSGPTSVVGPVLPENPIDLNSIWKCKKCDAVSAMSGMDFAMAERRLKMELDATSRTVGALEAFVEEKSETLWQSHALLIEAKQRLAIAYGQLGQIENGLPSSAFDQRKRAEKRSGLWREVLQALKILEPGLAGRIGEWFGLGKQFLNYIPMRFVGPSRPIPRLILLLPTLQASEVH